MYPTLSKLLSSVYSICFPLDLTEDYSKVLVKKRDTLFAKIERAENEGRSLTFSIENILDSGIENLQPLNLPTPILTYIKQSIQKIIAYYAEHFVFYTPSIYFGDDTTNFVLQYFLPMIKPLIVKLEFVSQQELLTIPPEWYLVHQNKPNSPFATVIKSIIISRHGSQRKAFDAISIITGRQAESVRSSVRRWIQGSCLPQTIYDCLKTLGIKETATDQEKTILYLAIILSKYYNCIYLTCNINGSFEYLNFHGESDFIKMLFKNEPSYLMAPMLGAFGFHNRNMNNKAPEARSKYELFLEKNSRLVTDLNLSYLEETVWGRYYSIIDHRPDIALEHYMRAFKEGKYRAGLFQRQICNEALHCASILGKKREFYQVFRWAKFSDEIFHKKMGYAEMSEYEASNFFKHISDNTLYRLHGDEFTISVLKNLVG